MSGYNDKLELSENHKQPMLLNRSITLAGTEFIKKPYGYPTLERVASMKKFYNSSVDSVKGKVKKLRSLFDSPKSIDFSDESSSPMQNNQSSSWFRTSKSFAFDSSRIRLLGTEDRVVVYLTSLRGIRRTYDDCYSVRMIFRGFRVMVDERDISMDSEYRKELERVLGQKNVTLPQVFIKGDYVGGVDLVRHLNEIGELGKMLKDLPIKPIGYVCEICGDARFVPCGNCSGSKKIFDEDEDQLIRCVECNENGLIRCPTCCS